MWLRCGRKLTALRTSLEILFDTDLEQRPALETLETETPPARAYSDWDRNGEGAAVDWVSSDRVTSVREGSPVDSADARTDESAIIDVPEEPLLPPRSRERARFHYEGQHDAPYPPGPQAPYQEAPPYGLTRRFRSAPAVPTPAQAEQRFEPAHRQPHPQPVPPPGPPPPPEPQPGSVRQDWQPVNADGHWLPPGTTGSNWASVDSPDTPVMTPSGRRRRSRHSNPEESFDGPPVEPESPAPHGDPGRRARSRHSAEYRDYSVRNFISTNEPGAVPPPPPAAATAPPPQPGRHRTTRRPRHRDSPRHRTRSPRPATAARSPCPRAWTARGTARKPAVSRSPTCWRGCRCSHPAVAGVVAVKAELGPSSHWGCVTDRLQSC